MGITNNVQIGPLINAYIIGELEQEKMDPQHT